MTPNQLTLLAAVFTLYLALVRYPRYARRDAINNRFTNRPLSSMTIPEAHEIIRELRELEFPYTMHTAMKISLLKTGSIPTMTKLFQATGQLNARNASKRAADTEILLSEVHDRLPGSDPHLLSIARMNYLHARYRQAGKILDADMLHTLGSAVVDIVRGVQRSEWRGLSGVEKCAIGVFHRALGEALGIGFGELPGAGKEGGWDDGGVFVDEICEWTMGYEREVAKVTESNRVIGRRFMDLATVNVPRGLRGVVEGVVVMRLDEHIRLSMGFEKPNPVLVTLVHGIMALRKRILRYLSLPRPGFMRVQVLDDEPDKATGLYRTSLWIAHPWYVQPTFMRRWGPKAWFVRLFGSGAVPTPEGKYRESGYDLWTIGPAAQEKRGREDMEALFEGLKQSGYTQCPFHG
ncbi:hypothetical protein P170DRAFT_507287 [Aspergillus steynii IBT 23096]|uniref:ER-bound oxygenase mpaB/mpaB'/Rubber oxygenase catalytic domain-containing protein n=1 Tax=Aspergillus steynii IBT 23096 TaxID=1392250 RepID=A0A2I2GI49_9EURO|nr:uncharacterized protein P170DRAFT_507287 [Aspergillus steynii IBT 23096]PLB52517.1 hypothetical protein P170DRAFT_507287 [Aspergillus steynii IBT 23096]